MPTRIIFLRHGETEKNRLGIMQGDSDDPLTELGREQSRRAAIAMAPYHPVKVYTSYAVRARQTAEIVAEELAIPLEVSSLLREQGLGRWEGKTWEDIKKEVPEVVKKRDAEGWWFCPPGGEPRLRVRHRMLNFCLQMEERHANNTVVAVSHAAALYFFFLAVLGLDPIGSQPIRTDNGAFSVIESNNGKLRYLSLNERAHLEDLVLTD